MKQKMEEELQAMKISNQKIYMLNNLNTNLEIKYKIFVKKILEIEDKKKYVRKHQCRKYYFESGDKKEKLDHIKLRHEEMEKDELFYVSEDPSEDRDLCVEDCGFCRKIFVTKETFKKHKKRKN